ncbi:vomeronasal type-2 receptor 26-like [Protopterus annectens]|uniref:vomeronasal type-2 receptor 26-like n=1 Tax=Protopterus annectens TaxID=7888 RepID=UPI001CFBB5F9|nr:vomeronasal type-2 receptor 26-like [Protopterus annectens]
MTTIDVTSHPHVVNDKIKVDYDDDDDDGDDGDDIPTMKTLLVNIYPVLLYLKNAKFKNKAGEDVFYDEFGDSPALFDIQNWQMSPNGAGRYIKVGYFDGSAPPGQSLVINESAISWSAEHTKAPRSVCSDSCSCGFRQATRKGQPVCCFDCILCPKGEITNQTDLRECIKCPQEQWSSDKQDTCVPRVVEFLSYEDPLGAALASIATFLSLLTAAILCVFMRYRETSIVKANNHDLSYLLLLSLCLCFLCSLIFIGRPLKLNCMFRQISFGMIFSVCISCILAKTITVIIAFTATNPNSSMRKWVGPKTPTIIIITCALIQFVICVVWLAKNPSFPQNNFVSEEGKIILECNEGSIIIFYCMLGYLGVLACLSFLIAFLARVLPDTFNEAKYITFSMTVFASVWITFVPAYLSTKGKYMVSVEIFAILSSSVGLLSCIFFLKCYIILLRPELNTKEYLIGKQSLVTKK